MVEYIENGVKLGWLIEPQERRVEIYSPFTVYEQKSPDVVLAPRSLKAEMLSGFSLDLTKIWGG